MVFLGGLKESFSKNRERSLTFFVLIKLDLTSKPAEVNLVFRAMKESYNKNKGINFAYLKSC